MKTLSQRIAACIAISLAVALPAKASTFSVDYTDLWYIPNESGWGINLIQQNNILFATMFVYGTDNTPRWYVGPDVESTNGTSFSGTLYRTTGPYFGVPWNQAARTDVVAGNISVVFTSPTTATLTYTADGATVTKSVVRQTWRNENLSGNYLGGITANGSSCTNGTTTNILMFGSMTVSQGGSNQANMVVNFTTNSGGAATCTFNGTYGQAGRQGTIGGNWSCTVNGAAANTGTFTMSELDSTIHGFNGRFQGQDQFCRYEGNVGVVRDTL